MKSTILLETDAERRIDEAFFFLSQIDSLWL